MVKVFSLADDARDVYIQAYDGGDRRRTLNLGETTIRLARSWDVACRMHCNGDGAPFSRPFFTLQFRCPGVNQWSRSTERRGTQHPQVLSIAISGHLKADLAKIPKATEQVLFPESSPALQKPDSSMHTVADQLYAHAYQQASRSHFANAETMLEVLRPAVLSHLPKAVLSEVLDYDHVEVTISDSITRERAVSDILLNADGSERRPVEKVNALATTDDISPRQDQRKPFAHNVRSLDPGVNIEMTETWDGSLKL